MAAEHFIIVYNLQNTHQGPLLENRQENINPDKLKMMILLMELKNGNGRESIRAPIS